MFDQNTFKAASRFADREMRFDDRYDDRPVAVLEGYDPFLWYLSGASEAIDAGVPGEVLAGMRDGSQFRSEGGILTQRAMVGPAEDRSHRDGGGEGRMVDFHLTEFIGGDEALDIDGSQVGPRGLRTNPEGYELFSVHCQFYEDKDGDWTLEHWDPGVYYSTPDGRDKKKFLAEDGPTLSMRDSSQDATDLFIDNGSYAIEEGLELVADTLDELAAMYQERALELQDREERDLDDVLEDLGEQYSALEVPDEKYNSLMDDITDRYIDLYSSMMEGITDRYSEESLDLIDSYEVDTSVDIDDELYSDIMSVGDDASDERSYVDAMGPDEDPYEMAWAAVRWSTMADAVRTFRELYSFE